MIYEVRYQDKRGRYTEEEMPGKLAALRRQRTLAKKGIDADVYEVGIDSICRQTDPETYEEITGEEAPRG